MKGKFAIRTFDLSNVKLLDSRFKKQFDEMKEYYLSIPDDDMLYGFRKRAGLPHPGNELGGWYNNDGINDDFDEVFHTFGQWLGALARIYKATTDKAVLIKAEYLLEEWAKTIEKDGYFYYTTNCNAKHYVYEKMVGGLVDLYVYAKLESATIYLEWITDWAVKNLVRARMPAVPGLFVLFVGGDPKLKGSDSEWYTLSENLYRAYIATGNEKYRDFAAVWHYDNYWDAMREGRPEIMSKLHGYSHVNTLNSAAMAYVATGEVKYLESIKGAYELFQKYQCMASGGYAPAEMLDYPERKNGDLLEDCAATFEVPCGSWAVFKLVKYLMTITGEAKYGQWLETILYNAIGATLHMKDENDRKGKTYYYADYRIGGGRKMYHRVSYPCCSGTYPQAVAEYHNIIYYKDEKNVYVNVLIPSEVKCGFNGKQVKISQETSFPQEESSRIRISCDGNVQFGVKVRIPNWVAAEETEIYINDVKQQIECKPGSWAEINGNWKDNDVIVLKIPMHLRFVPIDQSHPNRAALMYGPVMLAIHGDKGGPLLGDISNPSVWINPVQGKALHFMSSDNAGKQRLFVPFYEIGEREWYFVYNDINKI